MCLGAISTVTETWDEGGLAMARVEGAEEPVCLMYVPEAAVGDPVLVHLGFAVRILDPDEAAEAIRLREGFGP